MSIGKITKLLEKKGSKLCKLPKNGLGAHAHEPEKEKAPIWGLNRLLRKGKVSDFLFLGADNLALGNHLPQDGRNFVGGRGNAILVNAGANLIEVGNLANAHGVVENIADYEHESFGVLLLFGLLGRGLLAREQVKFVVDELVILITTHSVQGFENVAELFGFGDFLFHGGISFLAVGRNPYLHIYYITIKWICQ